MKFLLKDGIRLGRLAGNSKFDVLTFVTPYPDFDIKMLNDYAHSKELNFNASRKLFFGNQLRAPRWKVNF